VKNELMVFNSCGHVTIEEVSDETFDKYTKEPGYSAIGELPPCRFRVGRTRRRAYVYPGRYSACLDCFKDDCLDL
jgi:hypothetical protein